MYIKIFEGDTDKYITTYCKNALVLGIKTFNKRFEFLNCNLVDDTKLWYLTR